MSPPTLLQILAAPEFFIGAALLLGLAIGSFLNVVIHRLPRMLEMEWQQEYAAYRGEAPPEPKATFNLAVPRSHCPQCGHLIPALENIPLLSYLFLRGKCRVCRAPIGLRYPLVEAAASLLAGVAAWHFGFGLTAIAAMLFLWILLALAMIDADTQLLPDRLTLPLLWLGLLVNLAGLFVPLADAVLGAMAGYLFLWAVYWLFRLATGKEGMGYGDFKLLAALGAWMGWAMLPAIVLLSSLVGALVGASLIVFAKRGRQIPIPFGPYLAAAGAIAFFYGNDLNRLYLDLAF
ncbi:MAG: A24 family peptidase [Betaproteobacteria bacterium]|nr:A24 family peptidase [Betaproteobacteria bacterium]